MQAFAAVLLLAAASVSNATPALTRGRRDACSMIKQETACKAITDKASCEASKDCMTEGAWNATQIGGQMQGARDAYDAGDAAKKAPDASKEPAVSDAVNPACKITCETQCALAKAAVASAPEEMKATFQANADKCPTTCPQVRTALGCGRRDRREAGSCTSVAGDSAIQELMGPAMGPMVIASLKCGFMADATATTCGADTDCEFADGKCGPNLAKAMSSIKDPALKMLMTAQTTCKNLKGAACSANSDCMIMGTINEEGCGMAGSVMASLVAKCGGTVPRKGDKCKGISKVLDEVAVKAKTSEKADLMKMSATDADVQEALPTFQGIEGKCGMVEPSDQVTAATCTKLGDCQLKPQYSRGLQNGKVQNECKKTPAGYVAAFGCPGLKARIYAAIAADSKDDLDDAKKLVAAQKALLVTRKALLAKAKKAALDGGCKVKAADTAVAKAPDADAAKKAPAASKSPDASKAPAVSDAVNPACKITCETQCAAAKAAVASAPEEMKATFQANADKCPTTCPQARTAMGCGRRDRREAHCAALEKTVADQEKEVAATEASVNVVVKAESTQTAEVDAAKKAADANSPAANLVSGAVVMVAAVATALVF